MRQTLSTLALWALIATPTFAAEPTAQHPPALIHRAELDQQLVPGTHGAAPSTGDGDVSIPLLEAAATALAKGGLPDALKGNLQGGAAPAGGTYGDR